jgi:hypothetical protein
MRIESIYAGGLLASACLAFSLAACDRSEPPSAVGGPTDTAGPGHALGQPSPFDGALMALKARETDPARLHEATRDLLRAYGYPVSDEAEQAGPGAPVGKVAAAAASNWYLRKTFNYGLNFGIQVLINVPNGGTLRIRTTHVAPTDPMVVAFSINPMAVDPAKTTVPILGVSDDEGGNADASMIWTNYTGASLPVTIAAVSFDVNTGGTGTLSITCTNAAGVSCGSINKTANMNGVVWRTNNQPTPPAACTGPGGTKIGQTRTLGGGYRSTLLAVNYSTRRGGYIRDKSGELVLQDVLGYGGYNFLIGYSAGQDLGFHCGRDGKSICYESTSYAAYQSDLFTCP